MQLSDLYEYIAKRKSVRSYQDEAPAEELIEELVDFLSEQEAPRPDIDWDFDILSYNEMYLLISDEPKIKASRYLVLRAEKGSFYGQNMGYLGGLADLWLSSRGLGTCWMSGIKISEDYADSLPYIISIAFGKTDSPHRGENEAADRLPLEKICRKPFSGDKLKVAEAVRLAPSAGNRQPISLMEYKDGDIEVFRKTSYINAATELEMSIDAGIVMAYSQIAGEALGYEVVFRGKQPQPTWGGKLHTVSVFLKTRAEQAAEGTK